MSLSLQGALSKCLPLVGCGGLVAGELELRGFMNLEEEIVPSSPSNLFSYKLLSVLFVFFSSEVYVLRTKISFLSMKKTINLFYLGHLISLNDCLLLHDLQIDVIIKL